jgi:hypothetical protein
MRTIRAYKLRAEEPVTAIVRPTHQGVFYKVESAGQVKTPDGPMTLVRTRQIFDLGNPDNDIAVLVGTFEFPKRAVMPQLWMWGNKFWGLAHDIGGNTPYYRDQAYLWYELRVANENEVFKSLTID